MKNKKPFPVVALGISLVFTVIALTPTWVWLILHLISYTLLKPEGFWQNLILGGVVWGLGIWVLGGIQILLLIGLIWLLGSFWFDKRRL